MAIRKALGWFCFVYIIFMGVSIVLETTHFMPRVNPHFIHLGGSVALIISAVSTWWLLCNKAARPTQKSKN